MTIPHRSSNARWNAYAQVVAAVGQIVITLVLVRLLEPADFGRVALVYLVAGIVALLDEGGFTTKLIANDERVHEKLNTLFWQENILGLFFTILVVLAAAPIALTYAQPDITPYLLALAPAFLLTAPRRFYQTLLFRDLEFREMGIVRIIAVVAYIAVTLVLAKAGYGVWSLVLGLLTRMLTETLGFTLVGRKLFWPTKLILADWRTGYGRVGMAKVGERILNYGIDRLDLIIIGQALGPGALGVYDVFKRLSIGFYQQVIPAFSRIALPNMARLQSQPALLAELYVRQLRYICLLLFPAYTFQAFFAEPIVRIVFGSEWTIYTPIFSWISLLLLVRSTSGPVDALLMARGWVKRELAYSLIVVGLVAGVLLYAVSGGLEAAVVAVTWVNVALTIPVYLWLVRPASYVTRRSYLLALLIPLLLSLLAVGSARLAYDYWDLQSGGGLLLALVITATLFACFILVAYPGARKRVQFLLKS